MEKFKKFFGDSKSLVQNFIINIVMASLVAFILPCIQTRSFTIGDRKMVFTTLIFIALYVGLFMSFKLHESNVQKSLLSALYVFFISNQIYLQGNFVNAIIFILLFVVHLMIVSDKEGKESNLVLYYVLVVLGLIYEIIYAITHKQLPGLLTTIPAIFLLINIDTKIVMYKELRRKHIADGTWDDETKKEAKKLFDV